MVTLFDAPIISPIFLIKVIKMIANRDDLYMGDAIETRFFPVPAVREDG